MLPHLFRCDAAVPKPPSLPALFAARLVQARKLSGLSQRSLGDKVGLGKATGSTRINRYERAVSSPGLAGLEALANALDVPAAFLLAEPVIAQAILAFKEIPETKHAELAWALTKMSHDHEFLDLVLRAASYEQDDWDQVITQLKEALRASSASGGTEER